MHLLSINWTDLQNNWVQEKNDGTYEIISNFDGVHQPDSPEHRKNAQAKFDSTLDKIIHSAERWSGLLARENGEDSSQTCIDQMQIILKRCQTRAGNEGIQRQKCDKLRKIIKRALKIDSPKLIYFFYDSKKDELARIVSARDSSLNNSQIKHKIDSKHFWKHIESLNSCTHLMIQNLSNKKIISLPKILIVNDTNPEMILLDANAYKVKNFMNSLFGLTSLGINWLFINETDEPKLEPDHTFETKAEYEQVTRNFEKALKVIEKYIKQFSGVLYDNEDYQKLMLNMLEGCLTRSAGLTDCRNLCQELKEFYINGIPKQNTYSCQYRTSENYLVAHFFSKTSEDPKDNAIFWSSISDVLKEDQDPSSYLEISNDKTIQLIPKKALEALKERKPSLQALLNNGYEFRFETDLKGIHSSIYMPRYTKELFRIHSKQFDGALRNPSKENFEGFYTLRHISFKTFEQILKMLFSENEASEITWENIEELLKAADYLIIEKIIKHCNQWLAAEIAKMNYPRDIDRIFTTLEMALQYNNDGLCKLIWNLLEPSLTRANQDGVWLDHVKRLFLTIQLSSFVRKHDHIKDSILKKCEEWLTPSSREIFNDFNVCLEMLKMCSKRSLANLQNVYEEFFVAYLSSSPANDLSAWKNFERLFKTSYKLDNKVLNKRCSAWLDKLPFSVNVEFLKFLIKNNGMEELINWVERVSISDYLKFCDSQEKQFTDKIAQLIDSGITCLDLNGCQYLGEQHLRSISSLTSLKSLNLSKCENITDKDLTEIIGLKHLCYLNLSGCTKLTRESINLLINHHNVKNMEIVLSKNLENDIGELIQKAKRVDFV